MSKLMQEVRHRHNIQDTEQWHEHVFGDVKHIHWAEGGKTKFKGSVDSVDLDIRESWCYAG